MMENIRNYWATLSDREKRLLIIAGILATALLAWLAAKPIIQMMGDVQRDHRAAVEREGRVAAKAALLKRPADAMAAEGQADMANSAGVNVEQFLAQSASEIGLSLSRQEARGPNGASFAIAGGKAAVVAAWLADLEVRGFAFDRLSITPQADGNVGVTADVRRVAE